MKTANFLLIACAAALCACSHSEPPPPPQAAAQPTKPLSNDNIFKSDINALNKAKAVQGTLEQAKQNRDKELQDQGG